MATTSDNMSGSRSLGTNYHFDSVTAPNSTRSLRNSLQLLLDEKEKDLQLVGTVGQRILEQRVELEQRVIALSEHQRRNRGPQTPDFEGGDVEYQRQLDELARAMQNWEIENEQLMNGFKKRLTNKPTSGRQVASDPFNAQSCHRTNNVASREHDVKFAYDIGTSLISEVRRLQSILTERDRTIQDMKAERDDVEKENDSLRTSLRHQEVSADKFKEENWNLEVQTLEIRSQFQDAQQTASRSESELKRATKQLAAVRETLETQKREIERLTTTYEEFKTKHETDVARAATPEHDVTYVRVYQEEPVVQRPENLDDGDTWIIV